MKKNLDITKFRYTANKFCESLGHLLFRGSNGSETDKFALIDTRVHFQKGF